jgi:hypothetical protein
MFRLISNIEKKEDITSVDVRKKTKYLESQT